MANVMLRVRVTTGFVGCRKEDLIDTGIDQVEWDDMLEEDRDAVAEKIAREWMFSTIDWGWEVA